MDSNGIKTNANVMLIEKWYKCSYIKVNRTYYLHVRLEVTSDSDVFIYLYFHIFRFIYNKISSLHRKWSFYLLESIYFDYFR